MTPLEILWIPPARLAAGDTLAYNRNLPRFLPSQGWSVLLTVSRALPAGGAQITFQQASVPDPTNAFHTFAVPGFMAASEAGEYVWYEEVINAGNANETHEILRNDHFKLGPNIAGGVATGQLKNPYELLLEAALKKLAWLEEQPFDETDQQRNRFRVEEREKLLERIKFYEAKVRNIRQVQQARNGQTPDNIQEAVFYIG